MASILYLLTVPFQILSFLLLVYVVMSVLISFQIINMHQQLVRTIYDSLRRLFEPILGKIRKYMPNTGSLDFSPIVLFVLLHFAQLLIVDIYHKIFL